jgi:hypothetical protein
MRFGGLVLLPVAIAVGGCTGTVSASGVPGDAEPSVSTSAVVIVERTVDSTQGTRAAASARFVRVSTPSSMLEGLRAIGAAGDLPGRGTCATVTSLTGGVATDEPAPVVELVDVGAVSLLVGGVETHLVPRQLPDVTDVVSGVVYARATDSALLPAGARYAVHVGGRLVLGGFDVNPLAPADPSDIHVAGENADTSLVVVGRAATLELTWAADGAPDVVYVDVQPAAVRCVLGDGTGDHDGDNRIHANLPAALLDDHGSLIVHRLHREPLRAQGFESGEIRFDFARSLPYARNDSALP